MPNLPEPLTAADTVAFALDRRLAHHSALAAMPIADIIAAIDRAAAGWGRGGTHRDDATLARLSASSSFTPHMLEAALDDIADAFRADALFRLLERELGDAGALDQFVDRSSGQRVRAYGPALTVTVLAGNVPQVAAEAMILTLLTKSADIIKAPSRDRLFPELFAASLRDADRRLASSLKVAHWQGGDESVERVLFAEADLLVIYGGAEAVMGVRRHAPPNKPIIVHGPKLSFGVVDAASVNGAKAADAAHDVAYLDQQGCVSPHTLYVHGPASAAAAVARLLAGAMEAEERRSPRRELTAAEASAIQQARGAAEFRPGAEVYADAGGTAWTVISDPDPTFAASCLNRLVYVKPLAALDQLAGLLAPVAEFLQTVGVAGDGAFMEAVANVVGPLGACRVCRLGRMQHPPADWLHDGRPRLLDRLRWVEIER